MSSFGRSRVLLFLAAAILAMIVLLPLQAFSYSRDDSSFYDGLQDPSGLPATQHLVLDNLGGLRLATDGTLVAATWNTETDLAGETTLTAGPLVGIPTLDASAVSGTLRLPHSPLAWSRQQTDPVLAATFDASADASDSYHVQGPMVVRESMGGATLYRMWYAGVPANGYTPRVFHATSTDALHWTRVPGAGAGGSVVDLGAQGAPDSRQVYRPFVMHTPSDTATPYRMWYSAADDWGGYISYATSSDGTTWAKYTGSDTSPGAQAVAVMRPWPPGSIDSYSVGEPSVLFENGIYKMWYTASDGNNLRLAYATSTDGIHWQKGGGLNGFPWGANDAAGWFSPTVWKSGPKYHMIYTGRKSFTNPVFKLIHASSNDGLDWGGGPVALNSGGPGEFDSENLMSAVVVRNETETPPHEMWYVGNAAGVTGDPRNRIGYATSNGGSSYSRVDGPEWGASVLDVRPANIAFDSKDVYGAAVVHQSPTVPFLMLYSGRSALDLKDRIGRATSTDGLDWSKITGPDTSTAVLTPSASGFDSDGVEWPSLVKDDTAGVTHMWFEGRQITGTNPIEYGYAIGYATATVSSSGAGWRKYSGNPVMAGDGSGFDATYVGHPSVVWDAGAGKFKMWYAGYQSTAGRWEIGYADSTTGTAWTRRNPPVLTVGGVSEFDGAGVYDPVVTLEGSTFKMCYTGEELLTGIRRVGYATSSDGITWVKEGPSANPSGYPYTYDEIHLRPGGVVDRSPSGYLMWPTGEDRFGWKRLGALVSTGPGYLANGSNTYEFDWPYSQEFRNTTWSDTVPGGTVASYSLAYYPTASDTWSTFTGLSKDATLSLPLTTTRVRWKVGFSRPPSATPDASVTPVLDSFTVNHADVHYWRTGSATSVAIEPPAGRWLTQWVSLDTVGTGQDANNVILARVSRPDGSVLVNDTTLTVGTDSVSLASISAAEHKLVVRFEFRGQGSQTPSLLSYRVNYVTTYVPPVTKLTAIPGNRRVTLHWVNPTSSWTATKIVRKTGGFPLSPTDGIAIYDSTGTATVDTSGLANGTRYYYAAYAHDGSPPEFSSPDATSTVPKDSVTVSNYMSGYSRRVGSWCYYPRGRYVKVSGRVWPSQYRTFEGTIGTARVYIQKYTYSRTTRRYYWKSVSSSLRTLTSTSRYGYRYRARYRGKYRTRTRFAGDGNTFPAYSRYRYYRLY